MEFLSVHLSITLWYHVLKTNPYSNSIKLIRVSLQGTPFHLLNPIGVQGWYLQQGVCQRAVFDQYCR